MHLECVFVVSCLLNIFGFQYAGSFAEALNAEKYKEAGTILDAMKEQFGENNAEYDTLKIPARFLCVDGYSLAEWVNTQKRAYKAGRLKDQRLKKLLEIGFQF